MVSALTGDAFYQPEDADNPGRVMRKLAHDLHMQTQASAISSRWNGTPSVGGTSASRA